MKRTHIIMKNIVNKMRFALLLGFLTIGMAVLAQEIANIEKMSMSTLMFLEEMSGKINLDAPTPSTKSSDDIIDPDVSPHIRPIASPENVNGVLCISSFIRVTDESVISELEALGVIIECQFDHGILTTLIPIEKIEEVAALEGVKKIEVSEVMRETTDNARQTTNADDVLTLSSDAIAAGLAKIYDGSGVILGIIDTGIDFQHIAFKDKNGNSRIKGLYCCTSSDTPDYNWTGSGTLPTTDNTAKDHGSHTSSIAGGSSVIVNGTNVSVTDNHANATYGGMAPGADLYLAGINTLYYTRISNAMQQMVNYASAQGKPLVISNSYGSTSGPHLGTSSYGDIVNQYFCDDYPNNICLFSAGNEAGTALETEGGGCHVYGTANSSNPLRTILRCHYYSKRDGGYYYTGDLAYAWCRTPNVSMGCRVMVLDTHTGEILTTINVNPTSGGSEVNGLSDYYSGTLKAYLNSSEGRIRIRLAASSDMKSTSYDTSNSNYYTSDYSLAVEFYPTSGTAVIDVWGGTYSYFNSYLTTTGYTWTNGSDDMSINDFGNNPNIILVGSYVSRERSSGNSLGDISKFSSYATPEANLMGTRQPWITAPGEVIIAAYNHNNTSRGSSYIVSVDNSTYPYGQMSGTSMASPCAAGIVAQWLQAANECGKTLTLSEVKNIMAQTAIKDSWVTSGANATHFGNGKIDALAGIEYILNAYGGPFIAADPTPVTFDGEPNNSYTQTVTVSGMQLTGSITASLNDPNGVYSINTTNLGNGGNLVITFTPTVDGSYPATITLTSTGAEPVIITLNGTAEVKMDVTVCDNGNANQFLPVYGYWFDAAQTNQMLYPYTKFTNSGMNGKTIKSITFYPTTGTYSSTSYSGINFYKNSSGEGTVTVKLANMPSGTAGYSATATRKDAQFTTVKTITMPTSAQTGLTEWVFDDLENDFVYEGGDLLIEVTTAIGKYGRTFFAGEEQSTYTGYYSYNSTSTGVQFLPKVTFEWDADAEPITAGTVSPTELTFTDVRIGRSGSETVTVTNTGNQPFTPVIDTTNLPAEFTVTGGGQLLPNGTLDLTVTYTPTDEGPHSGSFTITIGDVTYTVTVTGNGMVVNSTLTSNSVTVPVYKTELDVYGPYTYGQVIADTDHQLEGDVTNGLVKVQAKNIDAITDYRLFHNAGAQNNTVNMENWASGNNQSSVAYAVHNIANDNFTTYAKNGNAWAQDAVYTFQNGVEEMWIDLHDNIEVGGNVDTWYVPVTVANSKLGNENTYGSRMEQNPKLDGDVIVNVGYDDSSRHREYLDPATGMNYVYLTTQAEIIAHLPNEINGHTYECVMARAWRYYKPYIIGEGPSSDYVLELIDESTEIAGENGIINCVIGSESWTETNSNDGFLFNDYTFCVKDGDQSNVAILARLYYKRSDVVNPASGLRLSGSDGGYFAMDGDNDLPDEPTSVSEYFYDKELVSMTFVNPQGMTSNRPFEGVNIVIKRYSDGSTSTSKVLKR